MADPSIKILIEAVNKAQAQITQIKSDLDSLKGKVSEVNSTTKASFSEAAKSTQTLREAISNLRAQAGPLKDTLAGVATGTMSLGQGMSALQGILGGVVGKLGLIAAGVLGIAALKNHMDGAVSATQQWGGEIYKLSRMTGMGAQASSEFLGIAKMLGVTFDQMSPAIAQLARRMGGVKDAEMSMIDETGAVVDVFDVFKIKIKDDVTGNLLGFSAVFDQIRDKVRGKDNPFQGLAIATQFFRGQLSSELMPLLTATKERLAELAQKAKEYGLVITADNLLAIRQLTLAERELEAAQLGKKVAMGQVMFPLYTEWIKLLISVVGLLNKVSKGIREMWQGSSDPKEIQKQIDHWEKMEKWAMDRGDTGLAEKYNALADTQRARMGGIAKATKEEEAMMGPPLPVKPKGPSEESIAMKYFSAEIGIADRFAKDDYTLIESAKNKELALLKNSHEKGLIDQETYEQRMLQVMTDATTDEDSVINDRIGRVKYAFAKLEGKGVLDPDKLEAERTRVQGILDELNTQLEKNANQREILSIDDDTRRVQNARKIQEINDQQATSYETMSDRIAKTIDDIKVKNNEMLPGEALLAEHEREVNTLADQIKRALERVQTAGAAGSVGWVKAVNDYKLLKEKMVELDVKTPEVRKESDKLDAERRAANARALDEQHLGYALLIGDMDKYNQIQMQMQINELKTKMIRAEGLPEVQEGLKMQIKYMEDILGLYNDFGPAYAGFIEGLRDVEREAKNTFGKAKEYTKAFVEAFAAVPTKMLEDFLLFDGKFMKDLDSLKNYWKDFWGSMVRIFSSIFMDEMKILISSFLKGLMGGESGGLGGSIFGGLLSLLGLGGGGGSTPAEGESSLSGLGGVGGLLGLFGTGKTLYGLGSKLFGGGSGPAAELIGGGAAESTPIAVEITGMSSEVGADLAGLSGVTAGTEGGLAATGAIVGESSLGGLGGGGYLATAAPYAIPAIGAAVAMYMAYSSMTRDKRPQAYNVIGGQANELAGEYAGTGKVAKGLEDWGLVFDKASQQWGGMVEGKFKAMSEAIYVNPNKEKTAEDQQGKDYFMSDTAQGKVLDITNKLATMEQYREDVNMTREQIELLTKQALGPLNEGLYQSVMAYQELTDANRYLDAGLKLPDKTIKDLKLQFAGMDREAIDAIPNLDSFSAILKEIGIDTSALGLGMAGTAAAALGLEGAIADGSATFSSAGEALSVMVSYLGLSIDQSNALSAVFGGTAATAGNVADKIGQLATILGISKEAAGALAEALNLIPREINTSYTFTGEGPGQSGGGGGGSGGGGGGGRINPETGARYHKGGFVGRFHKGGFLKYHPWGGGIGGDEVPIIAQKGEYVLSKKDVEFIEKVKGGGGTQIVNIPPVLPRVNVVVNNQSSTMVQSAGAVRVANDQYIIDVLLKDLHSNGRLRQAFGFS